MHWPTSMHCPFSACPTHTKLPARSTSASPVYSCALSSGRVTSNVQVHPVVSRLCAPIDGTDPARLAHCLGLDASRFHKQVQSSAAQAREEIQLTGTACCDDEDRYKVSWLGSSAAAGVCQVCSKRGWPATDCAANEHCYDVSWLQQCHRHSVVKVRRRLVQRSGTAPSHELGACCKVSELEPRGASRA